MRKMILLGAVLASGTILLADSSVQPLNVKPGLWEVTMNMTISGSRAPQTRTYRSCLKKEDLNKYPFVDPEKKCTYTVSSSTGSTMEASGTCAPGSEGAKIDFKLRLDALEGRCQISDRVRIAIRDVRLRERVGRRLCLRAVS